MGIFNWYHEPPRKRADKSQPPRTLPPKTKGVMQIGGLPEAAGQRLSTQAARQGTPEHLWTSNLSVNELLLTRQCGFVPLGQVMGTSVFQIGMQVRDGAWRDSFWKGESVGYELDILTNGFLKARNLALGRLKQEAELLGATGVLGVQITHRKTEWGTGLLEFSVIGTAIRETHLSRPPSTPASKPQLFLSELSGQEYWQLRQAGFRPVGIAIGYCVYCQLSNADTQNTMGGGWFNRNNWRNVELTDFTSGLYSARSLAMTRMEEDALAVEAQGIVSVNATTQIEVMQAETTGNSSSNSNRNNLYYVQKMIYHFSAIGTAIQSFPIPEAQSTPTLTVSLGSKI